jgi:hypothetical protein
MGLEIHDLYISSHEVIVTGTLIEIMDLCVWSLFHSFDLDPIILSGYFR